MKPIKQFNKLYRIPLGDIILTAGTQKTVINYILTQIIHRRGFVLVPCSLNDLFFASKDKTNIYRTVDIATTDGMPLVWFARYKTKDRNIERVYGPTLMKELLTSLEKNDYSHYFIGPSETTLSNMEKYISTVAPRIKIIGSYSLPISYSFKVKSDYLETILTVNPSIIWIGISSPLQIQIAQHIMQKIPTAHIFCVGAAFDFLSGKKKQAPTWMQNNGLEWIFRLYNEPKRLWKRYIVDIPFYLINKTAYFIKDFFSNSSSIH